MGRCGTASDHCCWLGLVGKCPYVKEGSKADFNWACSLREKYGSWDAVYTSAEYLKHIQPFWDAYRIPDLACGAWPIKGTTCNTCGEVGNG